ncbi:MAG: NAD(P)H-dependent oxidoreductase subunit E [Phycisphaerae bacterium]|nr:NAD(P)H-dependent oxidoreductase subunit E [Phycisphaerae bacterium]
MSRSHRQRTAAVLTATTGVIALLAIAVMAVDNLAALLRTPQYEAHVDDLLEKGETDAAHAANLHAVYERETAASLGRDTRTGYLSYVLLISAAAFLTCSKWLLTLRGSHVVPPKQVLAQLAAVEPDSTSEDVCESKSISLPIAEQVDLSAVGEIVARMGSARDATIAILHGIQDHYRYLPQAALRRVCEITEIAPAQLAGVASFFPQFRRTPIGEHVVRVCHGTACHVAGAPHISAELRRRLHIGPDEDTDAERKFTIQTVPCLGCCTLAPVVQIDQVTHGHTRPDDVSQLLKKSRGL